MIKSDLITSVASETRHTQSEIKVILESILSNIENALWLGDEVVLRGFGTFKMVDTAPRIGRNLNTNTVFKIPAKKRVRFKNHMKQVI